MREVSKLLLYVHKSFIHSFNFFNVLNDYLLKIRGNWFCFTLPLKVFLAGYVKHIPGLLPFPFVLGHCRAERTSVSAFGPRRGRSHPGWRPRARSPSPFGRVFPCFAAASGRGGAQGHGKMLPGEYQQPQRRSGRTPGFRRPRAPPSRSRGSPSRKVPPASESVPRESKWPRVSLLPSRTPRCRRFHPLSLQTAKPGRAGVTRAAPRGSRASAVHAGQPQKWEAKKSKPHMAPAP